MERLGLWLVRVSESNAYRKINEHFALSAFLFCLFGQVCDIVSSVYQAAGTYESNPLARHANGHFWLWHGIVLKAYFIAEFAVIGWLLYRALLPINRTLAEIASIVPLLVFACMGFDAAVMNTAYHFGWYVALAPEVMLW